MLPKPELAYFAIADISGYTNFLAGVELDHAQDIIADFMRDNTKITTFARPHHQLMRVEAYELPKAICGLMSACDP